MHRTGAARRRSRAFPRLAEHPRAGHQGIANCCASGGFKPVLGKTLSAMLDWHETPEALGPPVAGPFRFSKEGTRRRREARAVYLLAVLTACVLFVLAG